MKKTIDEKIAEVVSKQERLKYQENHLRMQKKQMEKAEREKRQRRIGKAVEDVLARPATEDDLTMIQVILEQHMNDFQNGNVE